MQEVYQNCEKHPHCLYQDINIASNCDGSRVKCIQCIYEMNGKAYRNQDYIQFKTIKENPFQYLQRTIQSPDLQHFLDIKTSVQSKQEKLNLFEKGFNIYVNQTRNKLKVCKKSLETIEKNQNQVLEDIFKECKVDEAVESIEKMIYLQDEELTTTISTLSQITTDLVWKDNYKQTIADKVQDFLKNQSQNIDNCATEYQNLQVQQKKLEESLKIIVEDKSLFILWNKQIQYPHVNQQKKLQQQHFQQQDYQQQDCQQQDYQQQDYQQQDYQQQQQDDYQQGEQQQQYQQQQQQQQQQEQKQQQQQDQYQLQQQYQQEQQQQDYKQQSSSKIQGDHNKDYEEEENHQQQIRQNGSNQKNQQPKKQQQKKKN